MIYVYIWFDCVGYSRDVPTEEDLQLVDSGDVLILEFVGDVPKVFQGKEIQECQLDTTPDGTEYHYVAG